MFRRIWHAIKESFTPHWDDPDYSGGMGAYVAPMMVDPTQAGIIAVAAANEHETVLAVGDRVSKVGGDYKFDGVVVCVFKKLSGEVRYVVEDDRGVLHVYSRKNLKPRE